MSENGKKEIEEQENRTAVPARETVEDDAAVCSRTETEEVPEEAAGEQDEKEEAAAAVKEVQEKYMRLQADFANFKKRSAAERLQVADTVKSELIAEILPVIDNFERALQVPAEEQSAEVKAFMEGCKMIYKQLTDVLEKAGVRKMEALGKPFDPVYHQAVMRAPVEGYADDTVAEVLQEGYLLGDTTIRPAMVKVAFNG